MYSTDLWATVEEIEDALAQNVGLHEAMREGLRIMLGKLERPGGALYLPRFCEHVTADWTTLNIPDSWSAAFYASHMQLTGLAKQAADSGSPVEAAPHLGLAGVLPVIFDQRSMGALLVHGEPLTVEEIQAGLVMLRPFARVVSIHTTASANPFDVPGYSELLRSRNTLRSMFDSLPISIYIIDSDYNLAAVNQSHSTRVVRQPSQLVGRKCYEIFYGRSGPCEGCRVSETFEKESNTTRIERRQLEQDVFEEWEISTFPIIDDQNQVTQAIVTGQDVTEKRLLEANLRQSEKLAAVGQLAAGVAHEINNPLTAIIANAQLLRQEISPENRDLLDSVKLIEVAGTRASQVVRNLLGLARKERLELEPVDLNMTIYNALTLVQHELAGRSITVQMELSEDMPLVSASQDQLQSVWINLLINAIDAIDKDPGVITITSQYTDGQFEVTISDNGVGISPEQVSKVFEPFYTTKPAGRGTGLGLPVCMRAVRLHGGNLRVDSQPGKWACFTVSLPGPR